MDLSPLLTPAFLASTSYRDSAQAPDAAAVFEVVFLAASVDGEVGPDETAQLQKVAAALGVENAEAKIVEYTEVRGKTRLERLQAAAARLTTKGERVTAFSLAFAMTLSDLSTNPQEEAFQKALATALGLEGQADDLRATVYESLHAEE